MPPYWSQEDVEDMVYALTDQDHQVDWLLDNLHLVQVGIGQVLHEGAPQE